ncbi:transposase [Dyella acidiphila]|uniref:Transposase n=1 Tax=Dyella acidiphila TaxID=2775866 RepID=A0ABR9G704_9GAMM|nr:transposase [Dyella acidiphila]MBE1159827.1 transposase [Dyella acidiphila]
MPRSPRFDLAGVPQHVIQRGHGHRQCFFAAADCRCYLAQLLHASQRWQCAVHAYVLMPNHVHLLLTPSSVGALASMMQSLGRNYVSYVNVTYRRSGTLWEGRYKSCLVDAEDYLLRCYRYIELNPVRVGLVGEPSAYAWSSYGANALGDRDPLIVPHSRYLALGSEPAACQRAYRQLFASDIDGEHLQEIRTYIQQQRALGSPSFQAWVEHALGRYAKARPAHRPRRSLPAAIGGD